MRTEVTEALSSTSEPIKGLVALGAPTGLEFNRTASSTSVTISWTPPAYSYNITINYEVRIIYCLEVYNITCGQQALLVSDCHVHEMSYTNEELDQNYIYKAVITPRENVERAINGTQASISEKFPVLDQYVIVRKNDSISTTVEVYLNITDSNIPLPGSYSILLLSIDNDGDDVLADTLVDRKEEQFIVLNVVTKLKIRRVWNYVLLAYGCPQHPITNVSELSTHDIQDISVTSQQPGEIRVTADFIAGSTATGALVVDIIRARNGEASQVDGRIMDIVGGKHSISVFVVEKNGLPFTGTASTPKTVFVHDGTKIGQSFLVEYSLQSTFTGICINCSFLDSSATDCVVVVHRRISQLNSSGLMNIESSHKFNRSGDSASGCIEGVNLKDYQVGVIGGKLVSESSGNKHVCTECVILGTVFGTAFFAILLTMLMTCILIITKKGTQCNSCQMDTNEAPVEMERCTAYEVTSLYQQKVVLKGNPSYELHVVRANV